MRAYSATSGAPPKRLASCTTYACVARVGVLMRVRHIAWHKVTGELHCMVAVCVRVVQLASATNCMYTCSTAYTLALALALRSGAVFEVDAQCFVRAPWLQCA